MNKYDVAFSFDTTGSMTHCIGEVRKGVTKIINDLFDQIPGIRISIIAHGDYDHENNPYLMTFVDFTTDRNKLIDFVKTVANTGSNSTIDEAYEYVLRESQKLSWDSEKCRALVMIGDAPPHEEDQNPYKINWRHELKEIKSMGINIYSIHCRPSGNSTPFFKAMAEETNGYYLKLEQFSSIVTMMNAICFKQVSDEALREYQERVNDETGGMDKAMRRMFDVMLGNKTIKAAEKEEEDDKSVKAPKKAKRIAKDKKPRMIRKTRLEKRELKVHEKDKLVLCKRNKFKKFNVLKKMSIKQLAEETKSNLGRGKSYFEFTKPMVLSNKREFILQNISDGCFYEGEYVKQLMGLDISSNHEKIKLTNVVDYKLFVQCMSSRKFLEENTIMIAETQ